MILEKSRPTPISPLPRVEDTFTRVIDRRLPEWARRSNPIVRRSLGGAWKLLTPDFAVIARLYAIMSGVVIAIALLPGLLMLLMPTVTITLVVLPIGAVLYVQALYDVGTKAASSIAREKRDNTLPLLLTIPRSLLNILASKLAAAVWRQIENINLIVIGTVFFSLPLLMMQYDLFFAARERPLLVYVGMIIGLGVSILRIFIEPIMVAALGTLSGAAAWGRIPAIVMTVLLTSAYFALINLARLLPLDIGGRLLVEWVLPLVLPILIIGAALRLTTHLLTRD